MYERAPFCGKLPDKLVDSEVGVSNKRWPKHGPHIAEVLWCGDPQNGLLSGIHLHLFGLRTPIMFPKNIHCFSSGYSTAWLESNMNEAIEILRWALR